MPAAAGHEVVALPRRPGAEGAAVDALDATALGEAVRRARPNVVAHLL
ncbi:MAG: NAD(P)-dependent oxidoreductase, partial [Streptomyces sp.]|nr:NAD(P)-dependent oxidoreductase [Streptomyces sp.]